MLHSHDLLMAMMEQSLRMVLLMLLNYFVTGTVDPGFWMLMLMLHKTTHWEYLDVTFGNEGDWTTSAGTSTEDSDWTVLENEDGTWSWFTHDRYRM